MPLADFQKQKNRISKAAESRLEAYRQQATQIEIWVKAQDAAEILLGKSQSAEKGAELFQEESYSPGVFSRLAARAGPGYHWPIDSVYDLSTKYDTISQWDFEVSTSLLFFGRSNSYSHKSKGLVI